MSDHHNVLSAAVVALVAVAGLVLYYANSSAGAVVTYGGPGPISEPQHYFELGLDAGHECMLEGSASMFQDEFRMCCENKCNTNNKCLGQSYLWGLRLVNECSRSCNSGCREQIRRETLLLPKTDQFGTGTGLQY
ncbi:hypothetical protein HY641_04205 [Candidatus Woesearchaeota archaeon]|nr:hypothetical protein [Candidatus Woesearchaeota archaeon]